MAINLQKGQKVSLEKKSSAGLGEILVNLNWNARPQKKGFLSSLFASNQGIDLDLGCLFELKDGRKGTVQALGNCFGSLNHPPFIALDGDDRRSCGRRKPSNQRRQNCRDQENTCVYLYIRRRSQLAAGRRHCNH